MKVLVTGGAGFIGSAFLRLSVPRYPGYRFINADKLTYAANLRNLAGIERAPNYEFVRLDIGESSAVEALFDRCLPDVVVHFAAESHVDRSILGPREFFRTNVEGTFNLLEAARRTWGKERGHFHHVSTDEVYGSLGDEGRFSEATPYAPSSPYSASKASSDHFVRAYGRTYNLRATITNCSNNYGPFQFPEKLLPLMILHALERKPLPIYGAGLNVRDWLYVDDHVDAIWRVIDKGRAGETYNVGGDSELRNIDVVDLVCEAIAAATDAPVEELRALKQHIVDRPGHDQRYAIDHSKITRELGWAPQESFGSGLERTVRWYLDNLEWVQSIRTGEYRDWMDRNYGART